MTSEEISMTKNGAGSKGGRQRKGIYDCGGVGSYRLRGGVRLALPHLNSD
jgi:hypothetical protein